MAASSSMSTSGMSSTGLSQATSSMLFPPGYGPTFSSPTSLIHTMPANNMGSPISTNIPIGATMGMSSPINQVQTMFANQPFFPPTPLQLPSFSDSHKLTPNNYHTWSMFMQIILESAGVWVIISTPNSVPINHQLQMDARAKTLMVHGMSTAVIPQFLTMRSTAPNNFGEIFDCSLAKFPPSNLLD